VIENLAPICKSIAADRLPGFIDNPITPVIAVRAGSRTILFKEDGMSQSKIDLIRRAYDAFRRRDLDTVAACCTADVRLSQSAELPWGGTYQGLDGIRQFLASLTRHIDSAVEIERFIDAGDAVLAIGRTRGIVRSNGEPFDVPFVHLWELQDGQIVGLRPYIDNPTMQSVLACSS
jgi:ketosteroid isomerase-like protein